MNNENIIIDDNDQFDDESGDNVGMNDILAFKKIQKHEKVPHANF
jgi:hypothetical protein